MLKRLVSVLSRQRVGELIVSDSRCIGGACHDVRDGNSTAESLQQDASCLRFSSSVSQQRCASSRASSWQECSVPATAYRSFTAKAKPELDGDVGGVDLHMSSAVHKALAAHFPSVEDKQVQPVLVASMTKLLCEPPAPLFDSTEQASASSQAPHDREGTPDRSSSAPEKAPKKARKKKEASSDMAAESPTDRELAKKQASYRYAAAQRERWKANVAKSRSKRPQQDFTRYHEKLKAEARAARDTSQSDERAAPPHSPEALQEVAKTVALTLQKEEAEVSGLLQRSPYGAQQAPAPLPDTEQVKATLQELLRIFGAIAKYNPTDTVWIKVLQRRPALLSCTVDQIRNTVSFLEMLDMSPAQIGVCLSKAPKLLSQNLEDKLLPLCDYLNRIGLDLQKQRTLVTWRPEVLSHRLEGVKGQCALLAGYGIQGEVLANVLYRSSSLIMAPRVNVALRLKYLFGELGCTPEDIRRGPGIMGTEAAVMAFRVAWLRHLGREVQLPTQVPGGLEGWQQFKDGEIRGKTNFGPGDPIPLWFAVRCTLRKLCTMLDVNLKEAQKFERKWRASEEAKRWQGILWRKKAPAQKGSASQTAAPQDPSHASS